MSHFKENMLFYFIIIIISTEKYNYVLKLKNHLPLHKTQVTKIILPLITIVVIFTNKMYTFSKIIINSK